MELTEFPARYCRHEDAARKRHSTVGEALGIASQMTAALAVPPCRGGVATEGLLGTVLTHFSQRYPTVPPEQEGGGGRGRVLFAFDGMCIPLDPPKLEGERCRFLRFAESKQDVYASFLVRTQKFPT